MPKEAIIKIRKTSSMDGAKAYSASAGPEVAESRGAITAASPSSLAVVHHEDEEQQPPRGLHDRVGEGAQGAEGVESGERLREVVEAVHQKERGEQQGEDCAGAAWRSSTP